MILFVADLDILPESDVVHRIVVEVVRIQPELDALHRILGYLTPESDATHQILA